MSDRANGKKTFRRTAALLLALLMLFTAGCRASSYMAVGMVRTNTKNSANLSFYSLKGRLNFTVKSAGEGDVTYSAKLESGTERFKEGTVSVFWGSFSVNYMLPNLFGLGRSISRGFGTVKQIKDKELVREKI